MEGLKSLHDRLKILQSQAKKLIDAGLALNARFAEEETRQKREDEVSILMSVRCAIVEQLQELQHIETSASYGHSEANLELFLAGLALTAMFSKNNLPSAIMDYLRRRPGDRHRPFGTVMVRVGPKGLPDDARAVSISQSARDSNRSEPEIVNGLQGDGYLLFSEEAFSLLIDRLVVDVSEGKLHLPISRDKLAQIMGLNRPKSNIEIVPIE
jgi:hypothetical protein